uniref:Uncharacterized protein n=1 Tax=Plectus sambesii TaxID=2011161 RepID=A0A914XHI2_9BILA
MKIASTLLLFTLVVVCPQIGQCCDLMQGSLCSHAMDTCLNMCNNDLKCLCNCWETIACPTCLSGGCMCFVPSGCNQPASKWSNVFMKEFLQAQSKIVQGKN